jgi:ribosomal protein S18 acetylase RimI-like enzyme
MAWETERFTLDRETVWAGVTAVFDDPGKGRYWVAQRESQVVGCLLLLPEWSDWRNGQVWWIHSVYILPHARQQGVFRSVFQQLQRFVREDAQARGLRLYVEKENLIAQQVYRSLGMHDEHYFLFEWMPDAPKIAEDQKK